MVKGSCIVGQSGGPTSVINASLAGVIETAINSNEIDQVYGAINGVSGIINDQLINFTNMTKEELTLLKTTPGAFLGSVRYHLGDYNNPDYKSILKIFKKYNIRYFFYIGGNDSMDTCHKIACFLKQANYEAYVIGIPKTIDNDLVLTDHTPGYGSTIKYIASTISQIYLDTNSYSHGRVTIVEIMGRDAGWLTAGAALAKLNNCGPDLIYLPEIPLNIESFLEDIKKIYQKKQKVLVAVGEGIKTSNHDYLLRYRHFNNSDDFGHLQLGGVGLVLCEMVSNKLNLPVRSIELNLPQRCASHFYSQTDFNEAYNAGKYALKFALNGHSDQMVVFKRTDYPYHIDYDLASLCDVATKIKFVPNNFINEEHNNITDEYLEYAKPLIEGEVNIPFENGLPKFIQLKK